MENEAKETRPRRRATATAPEQERSPNEMDRLGELDVSHALATVTDYAKENPHVALAAAAGVGFVLGGGLTPRMLAGIAMFVGRRYANVAMRDALSGAILAQRGAQEG